jgi:hypothetical protein
VNLWLIRPFELETAVYQPKSVCMVTTITGLVEVILSDIRCIDTPNLSRKAVETKLGYLKVFDIITSPGFTWILTLGFCLLHYGKKGVK